MLRSAEINFVSKWDELGDVCYKTIRCETVSRDRWQASFADVHALCASRPVPLGPKLYDKTSSLIKDRIIEVVNALSCVDNDSLLSSYVHHWESFHRGLGYLDTLCGSLNTQYVAATQSPDTSFGKISIGDDTKKMEIMELGLSQWKTYLIEPLQSRFTSSLLAEVANDRMHVKHDQRCIIPCLESFMCVDELRGLTKLVLDVYKQFFEVPLLENTRLYYANWAEQMQTSLGCTDYVTQALALRTDETDRATKYYKHSLKPIEELFKDIIVQQRLDFLNASIPEFIKNEDKTALANIFQLLSPTNQCSELFRCFGSHVKDLVNAAISNLPTDQSLAPICFVENLLKIRQDFVSFIDEVFEGVSSFRNEMDKAFCQSINSAHTPASSSSQKLHVRAAGYLSRYMDMLLRKCNKQYSETELDSKIAAAITLFKYIEEKDAFRKCYEINLCHRLIFGSSTTLEVEESAINQLNKVCGHEFTNKFQRMFNDIQLSDNVNTDFQRYLTEHNKQLKFVHHFGVLTLSAWPISVKNTVEFCLPSELLTANIYFEDFYKATFNGRRLRWAQSHSIVELRACYTDKPYIISLTSLSASVLLLFDSSDVDRLTVRDVIMALQPRLSESTPLTETPAKTSASAMNQSVSEPTLMDTSDSTRSVTTTAGRTPQASVSSLSSSPFDVDEVKKAVFLLLGANILISPNGQFEGPHGLTEDTILELNYAYTNKRMKVKINYFPQSKETVREDAEQMEKQLDEDRRFFTQAAIVRIMKIRKTCKHTMLIKCVLETAKGRFQPPVPLIKRSIENLIEKSYLERCPNDPEQYNYLA